MSSSQSIPESLVKRLRALAEKRQKEAAREGRVIAQGLLGAAEGYRALADALERQPSLSSTQQSRPSVRNGRDGAKQRDVAMRNNAKDHPKDAMSRGDV